eukprot:1249312-Rhodomonas_salina.1
MVCPAARCHRVQHRFSQRFSRRIPSWLIEDGVTWRMRGPTGRHPLARSPPPARTASPPCTWFRVQKAH